jgi:hypothetical protein
MLHNITRLIPDRADKDGGPEQAAVLTPKTNFKIGQDSFRSEFAAAEREILDVANLEGTSNNDDFFVGSITGAARR